MRVSVHNASRTDPECTNYLEVTACTAPGGAGPCMSTTALSKSPFCPTLTSDSHHGEAIASFLLHQSPPSDDTQCAAFSKSEDWTDYFNSKHGQDVLEFFLVSRTLSSSDLQVLQLLQPQHQHEKHHLHMGQQDKTTFSPLLSSQISDITRRQEHY